jgi:2-keto-4-pentenoate hydratase/2-oxohepta-3-ene-1,7-dioic acid hydratase in catechol pathway
MKLVSFAIESGIGGIRRLGVLIDGRQDGRIIDLTAAYAAYLSTTDEPTPEGLAALRTPPDMIGWLRGGAKSREAAEHATQFAARRLATEPTPRGPDGARLAYAASEVRLLATIPRPNTLRDFSIYEEHMTRSGRYSEKKPVWYTNPPYYKGNPEAIVGPGAPIPFPYYTQKLDVEIEIGIIIGKKGRNLTFDEARGHIAGYTILLDPSCRDGHDREPFGPNKRKDWCTVLGPCLVTPDEIDEGNLKVRVSVDGETWFEGNTGHKRSFTPEQLVAYASDNETLLPGDVLGTGTVGFGCSMDLQRWPQVGQKMTFEIEGIGTLTHEIVRGERVVEHVLGMKGLLKAPAKTGPSTGPN